MTTFEKLVLRALSIILLAVAGPRTVRQAEEWLDDARSAALETK